MPKKPATPSTMESEPRMTTKALSDLRIPASSPWPLCCDSIVSVVPLMPIMNDSTAKVIGFDSDSAASASAPSRLPTQRLSTNWYEVCSRLLMNIGPANQSMFLVIEPLVKSCAVLLKTRSLPSTVRLLRGPGLLCNQSGWRLELGRDELAGIHTCMLPASGRVVPGRVR